MKTPLHSRSLIYVSLAALLLTSCKETQLMQTQLSEENAKILALQAEMAQMDANMVELRKHIPAGTTPEAAAKPYAAKLASQVASTEAEITQAQASIQALETELVQTRQALETLRAKVRP